MLFLLIVFNSLFLCVEEIDVRACSFERCENTVHLIRSGSVIDIAARHDTRHRAGGRNALCKYSCVGISARKLTVRVSFHRHRLVVCALTDDYVACKYRLTFKALYIERASARNARDVVRYNDSILAESNLLASTAKICLCHFDLIFFVSI